MTVHNLMRLSELQAELEPEPFPARPAEDIVDAPSSIADDIAERTARVAKVAALHAEEVDRDGRFPREAITAAKALGLMGLMAPPQLGGEGASLGEIADVCYALGRACASTAMIYAMHQVKVACVVRHGIDSAWHEAFIRRLVRDQLLLASSTTEGQGGGNVRSSEAPIERDGGAHPPGARRQRDLLRRRGRRRRHHRAPRRRRRGVRPGAGGLPARRLHPGAHAAAGTRWACAAPAAPASRLRAAGEAAQILPVPYEHIHAQSMVPTAHLLWSSAWAGIAAAAVEQGAPLSAQGARRAAASCRRARPISPAPTPRCARLRALIAASLDRYESDRGRSRRRCRRMDFQSEINLLKVDASELAVATVMSALRCGGLSGYRNDSDVSIGRHLRDVLSSPIMINNDRILANVAASALLSEIPASIRG